MKVRITIQVDEVQREAIAALNGRVPIASHASVKAWAEMVLRATLDEVCAEHEANLAPED